MSITKKATLLVLAFAVVCAVALAGCGSASTISSASARSTGSESVSASTSSSTTATQQADEQAMAYVGTWKTNKLTLQSKTNASDKEINFDVPVTLKR